MDVEGAIKETEERAKELLFDAKGKRRDIRTVIGLWVFQVVLRMDDIHIATGEVFDWQGTILRYDVSIGHLLIADARAGGSFCDRVVCFAAAVMLNATGGISDPDTRASRS